MVPSLSIASSSVPGIRHLILSVPGQNPAFVGFFRTVWTSGAPGEYFFPRLSPLADAGARQFSEALSAVAGDRVPCELKRLDDGRFSVSGEISSLLDSVWLACFADEFGADSAPSLLSSNSVTLFVPAL